VLNVLASTFLSFWVDNAKADLLRPVGWPTLLNSPWLRWDSDPEFVPDLIAQATVQQHLNSLMPLGMQESKQGLWIQVGNQVLAENEGKVPLSAASLTKIATTLASLDTWGVNYQFETVVGMIGTLNHGVLQGDLVVEGSGDPYFVWEEAIALGNALQRKGINRVTGNLIITGNFGMNFETDPVMSGDRLIQGLNADRWDREISLQYESLPVGTPRPHVQIDGTVQVISPIEVKSRGVVPLVRHRSLPLHRILKIMNTYSNNMMADSLATQMGGPAIVAQRASLRAGIPRDEISLINGSGLGEANRISPRAISAMLIALQRYLETQQMNVADVLPVMGVDGGTISRRHLPVGAAVKTGTLNAVSALAGVLPTRDRGLVWFTIINEGLASLGTLHDYQDLVLQTLKGAWGAASPIPPDVIPNQFPHQPEDAIGAPDRNQLL